MIKKTEQENFWEGDFGKAYSDRNDFNIADYAKIYEMNYGISRTSMNEAILKNIDKNIRILEVGCNIGMQLRCLQNDGYKNLYGLELQWYAVEKSKNLHSNINIIQGSGFDIPFKDNYFDLVMTNGVLIHIAPNDHYKIMSEITRCSKQYILGFEYFNETTEEITYRGNNNKLWKADFANIYQQHFDLTLINQIKYPYISNPKSIDALFLLEKN